MATGCYIGIDQGSSATKAVVVSTDGQILYQTRKDLPLPFRDDGRIEHDGEDIFRSVMDALTESVRAVKDSGVSASDSRASVPHALPGVQPRERLSRRSSAGVMHGGANSSRASGTERPRSEGNPVCRSRLTIPLQSCAGSGTTARQRSSRTRCSDHSAVSWSAV